MAKFISVLIARSHQRLVGFALWLAVLALALVAVAGFAAHQVGETMLAQSRGDLEQFVRLRTNVASTFGAMKRDVTAIPCSPQFHDQLRQIAYLPDGLNEFIYAPGDVVQCSVNIDLARPVVLGPADIVRDTASGVSYWFDRDLDFLGLTGLTGSIVVRGAFGMIVPAQKLAGTAPDWMRQEVILVRSEGKWWHRGGEAGIYENQVLAGPWGNLLPLHHGAFYTKACDTAGFYCIVAEAALGDLLEFGALTIVAAIVICGLLAAAVSGHLHRMIWHFWAFEARFRRHFKARNILCVYQPVMALGTGVISGCEVLVRWRDVDGTTVFPDQFLPVVEKHGLGMQLTRFVVERAHEELRDLIPGDRRLQVNFNIFPRDLDAARLREVFSVFEDTGHRFDLVVEIVESDEVDMSRAQREIETLRQHGIRTHLDDFGTGYSNLQNLAALSLDGVKVDRSFAMAPKGSLMDKMLLSAIEMIHAAGRRITIEGVETEERLAMLKATGLVDFVQGYLISRPLDIGRFAQFLDEQSAPRSLRPRLVA